jgi:ABC-type transport system involved in multi-copper enzyme maturation permease subunit
MTWLTWRQYRIQFSVAAAVLAAFAVLLLITGLQMAAQYHVDLAACTATRSCANQASDLFLGNREVGFLVVATLGAPLIAGLFWGAPLVSSELETGTAQFAWTQSVTRKRWLAVKAGWMLLAAAAWGGIISGLVTWWSGPKNALYLDQFDPGRFDIMGIVPVAYALFAMALGICAGALLRRTLPAMAVTFAGFIAVRAVIALWLRPHYISAVTTTYSVLRSYTPAGSYWLFSQGVLGPNGHVLPSLASTELFGIPAVEVPRLCASLERGRGRLTLPCRQALGRFHAFVTYQPADRYWAFQGIETGIFLVLTAILITVAAIVLLRRDA